MKLYKKLSTATLALILAVSGLLGVTMQPAQAFSGAGGGVSGNPYIINTCAQLQEMKDGLAAYYKLGSDIDCDVAPYNTGSGFEPVGTNPGSFTGSLDGAGYTIDGLFISRSSTNNVGLFGYAGSSASITDVNLVNANVTGSVYTGVLVGNNEGTIEGSYAEGAVEGSADVGGLVGGNLGSGKIQTSYAAVSVSSVGSSGDCGGLVGLNSGTIQDSYATGSVHGANDNVYGGGLVGLAGAGTIQNSYASGNVTVASAGGSWAGGLVGVNSADIVNSYATGTPSATAEGPTHEGGLIGQNSNDAVNSYSVGAIPVGTGTSTGITGGQSLSSFYQTDPLHGVYTGTPPWDFGGVWHFANASSLPVLKLVEPPASNVVLNNAVNGKPVSITTPAGTDITCSSAIKENETAKRDSGYLYPDGLIKFCFDTGTSNNQVTLIFATSLVPGQVVARKYNSVTQTYATITDATITTTTYSGQPALSVTYTIVDNGPLDENPAVGAITDPVGLAVPNTEAPDTGLSRQSTAPLIVAIIIGMSLILIRVLALRRRTHDIS